MKKLTILIAIMTSLVLSACHPSTKKETTSCSITSDSIVICKGKLIMGHEAYSFTPEKIL